MKLYLVKSDLIKARYFFSDEDKATDLYNELRQYNADVVLKYLRTSDEWEVRELVDHFEQTKELL